MSYYLLDVSQWMELSCIFSVYFRSNIQIDITNPTTEILPTQYASDLLVKSAALYLLCTDFVIKVSDPLSEPNLSGSNVRGV